MKVELTQRELRLVRRAIADRIPMRGTSSALRSELRGLLRKIDHPTSRPKLDRRRRVPANASKNT